MRKINSQLPRFTRLCSPKPPVLKWPKPYGKKLSPPYVTAQHASKLFSTQFHSVLLRHTVNVEISFTGWIISLKLRSEVAENFMHAHRGPNANNSAFPHVTSQHASKLFSTQFESVLLCHTICVAVSFTSLLPWPELRSEVVENPMQPCTRPYANISALPHATAVHTSEAFSTNFECLLGHTINVGILFTA